MHSPDDDRIVREAFDELRDAERQRIPPFRRMWPSSRPQRARRKWSFAIAACALMIVIAGALLVNREEQPTPVSIPATWKGPTDFLLQTPGRELGQEVPSLQFSLKGTTK